MPFSSLTNDADFEKAVSVLVSDELERYAAAYRDVFTKGEEEDDKWKVVAPEFIDEIVANERLQFVHQITQKRKDMPKVSVQSIVSIVRALANPLKIYDQLTADTLNVL